MRKQALAYIKVLKELEDRILESLSRDIEGLLSDESLVVTLTESKKTSKQIGQNLQVVNKAAIVLLKSRGIYTPAATRAAVLYFLVSDLSKIE
jgi:dynein heavy chain